MTGAEIYEQIELVKKDYLLNHRDYQKAKEEIAIYVNEINKRGKLVASKHKKKYYNISAAYVLR